MSWIKKTKSIIIVHDVFPNNLTALGILKKNGLIYKLISKIFIYFLGRYNTIITLGVDMKDLIISKIPKNSSKVALIPNWSNFNDDITIRKANEKLNLFYTGNIGRVQNLECLIDLFQKANNLNIKLNILGDGSNRKEVESLISSNSLKNIFLKGSFLRTDETKIFKECDIAIISLINGMKGLAYPSKYYSYLANAKPILFIGDKTMDIANEIKSNNIGWVLDYNEPQSVINFFRDINNLNSADLYEKSKNSLSLAKYKYKKNIILDQYQKLILNI